jgi:hypothetical protein
MAKGCGHEEVVLDGSQPASTGGVEHGSVGSRYQATTGEDTTDIEYLLLVLLAVNCSVCKLAISL